MSPRLAGGAAAALLAAAVFAQSPPKPATATEPPAIKLRLDEADLRKLGPEIIRETPASTPAPDGSLPTLGGNPASQETRTRLFDRGASRGPFPKDENPNIR
jgi:hypothetical protein